MQFVGFCVGCWTLHVLVRHHCLPLTIFWGMRLPGLRKQGSVYNKLLSISIISLSFCLSACLCLSLFFCYLYHCQFGDTFVTVCLFHLVCICVLHCVCVCVLWSLIRLKMMMAMMMSCNYWLALLVLLVGDGSEGVSHGRWGRPSRGTPWPHKGTHLVPEPSEEIPHRIRKRWTSSHQGQVTAAANILHNFFKMIFSRFIVIHLNCN